MLGVVEKFDVANDKPLIKLKDCNDIIGFPLIVIDKNQKTNQYLELNSNCVYQTRAVNILSKV